MVEDIERHRADLETLCHHFGVRRLEIFGSGATGAFHDPSNDLDFLVEFEPPAGPAIADRFFGLLESLESLFSRPVDLVVGPAIKNPYFRESVDKTRTLIFAA